MSDNVTAVLEAGVLSLTLNRPDKLNCMDWEMLHQLETQVEEAEKDIDVNVLVVKGAGEKAFSSGADLKAFQALTADEARQWIMTGNRLFNKIEQLPKPTLAVMQGYALGGGLELALACDFRIAAENTVLSSPELQHGWLPGWGGMTRLRRLIGEAKAKEVVLLGQKISAQEAYRLGLLTRLIRADQLQAEAKRMLADLLKLPPQPFALAKAVLMDERRTTSGADLWFDVLALPPKNQ